MIKNKGKFTPPKYRRGQRVVIKDSGVDGIILSITYEKGVNWYRIKEKYYAEEELQKL